MMHLHLLFHLKVEDFRKSFFAFLELLVILCWKIEIIDCLLEICPFAILLTKNLFYTGHFSRDEELLQRKYVRVHVSET